MFFILRFIDHISARIVMEAVGSGEDYSALTDLTVLWDSIHNTCIDFKPFWTFRPMVTIRTGWGWSTNFVITVTLGSDIEPKQKDILRVFTTSAGAESETTFPVSATYKKCTVSADGYDFTCACTQLPCSYFVQLVYDNMAAVDTSTVTVCEIEVVSS